jgi:hypothetical protein
MCGVYFASGFSGGIYWKTPKLHENESYGGFYKVGVWLELVMIMSDDRLFIIGIEISKSAMTESFT